MKNPPPHNFENRSLPLRDPRSFAFMNMIGMITLYRKEVLRFLNVSVQTILAPVVTSFLFLIIFTLALGRAVQEVHGVGFSDFLAPGLIIMTMAQNAFANTSSSLIISKTQGNIVDVLMPPVSAGEFLVAYTMAAITRGMLVGLAITLAMLVLIDLHVVNLFLVIIFGLLGSLMLGLLGLIGGIWAEKFDHIAAVTNFLIMPLTFLSGTFYSINRLGEPFFTISQFNPFFYMIDGFRAGFIGISDAPIAQGLLVLSGVNVLLWWTAWWMRKSGYRLKA